MGTDVSTPFLEAGDMSSFPNLNRIHAYPKVIRASPKVSPTYAGIQAIGQSPRYNKESNFSKAMYEGHLESS